MKYNLSILLLTISLFVATSCVRMTNDEIKKSHWKYGEGFHICDVLILDDQNLKGDTIYLNDKPVALIIKSGGMFWESPDLEIKSFTTQKKGTYFEM